MAAVEDDPSSSGTRRLQCSYCSKAYSKAEHLIRHERSHTGVRPFVCKECKRSFTRQDSLARHEKLHLRRNPTSRSARSPGPPRPPTPSSSGAPSTRLDVPSRGIPDTSTIVPPIDGLPEHDWSLPPAQDASFAGFEPSNVDLDLQLMWPDSENLFHTIMSSDVASQWSMPLGTLPFPPTPDTLGAENVETTPGFVPPGEGQAAVQDLSQMVTNLSRSVTAEVESTSITSVFLDAALHMFFERFVPTFPVLHRATFVFKECTHPLLLNAIAIGSLYMGPKSALAKGEALWRLAQMAATTSWQSIMKHRAPYDACNGFQLVTAALLGQVYASLSRNRGLRTTSQIFHGLAFYWARHCGMTDVEPFTSQDLPAPDAPEGVKMHKWRTWVARETQRRVILALYILDGQIAQMSGDPTSVRHASNQLTQPSSEAAFAAETVNEWIVQMQNEPDQRASFRDIFRSLFPRTSILPAPDRLYSAFSCRVVLEGLQSLVSECDEKDGAAIGVPTRSEIRRALAQFHGSISANPQNSAVETMEILLRWHAICLDAAMDSSLLCRYVCSRHNVVQHIYGGGRRVKPNLDLIAWCNTDDARRTLLHAVAIHDIVEQLPRGRAHAVHMPTSLFAAATVYSVFSLVGITTVALPRTIDWKDVLFTEADPCVILGELSGSTTDSDTRRFVRGEYTPARTLSASKRNLLYDMNSIHKLFRCLASQWGIAHEMEQIVDQWIALCH